jgi:hypothetical protein
MANLNQARRKFKVTLGQKQNTSDAIPGLLGRGDGTVEVANQAGQVYIRVGNEESYGTAFNNRVPLSDNLPIFVGYDPITDPDRRLFQVLSIRQTAYVDAGNAPIPQVGPHHTTHEFGGGDDVYTEWRRIMGLRVGRPVLFVVEVDTGYIYRAGWILAPVGANTVDLTAEQAALVGTQAQLILISLDDTGAIEQTNGAIVASPAALTIANCPAPPDGNIPLAAVRIYATQTSIGDTPTAPDIIDLRFPTYDTMGTHALLGVTHDDTTPAAPILGDIITAQAGPVWARLAKGTQYQTLQGGATTPVWGAVNLAQATAITGALPVGNGGTGVTAGAWGLTGNAGTTAFTNFVGTTDNISIVFKTNAGVHGVLGSDAASVDGNARGTGATDWQCKRGAATHVASGDYSTIVGGSGCTVAGNYSVTGGCNNSVAGFYSSAFGYTNTVSGDYSSAFGYTNTAAGYYSVACGRQAIIAAAHAGSFLFSDQTAANFNSAAANEFAVRARGGVRLAYDDSYYCKVTVASDGDTTLDITAAAGTPTFTFSDAVGVGITPISGAIFAVHAGANQNNWVSSVGGRLAYSAENDARLAFVPFDFYASEFSFNQGSVGIKMNPTYTLDVTGNIRCSTGFGCNSKTPQTAYVSGGEKSGTATNGGWGFVSAAEMNDFVTMCKNIRLSLVANGIMS